MLSLEGFGPQCNDDVPDSQALLKLIAFQVEVQLEWTRWTPSRRVLNLYDGMGGVFCRALVVSDMR